MIGPLSAWALAATLALAPLAPAQAQEGDWVAIGLTSAWSDISMHGYGGGGEESLDGMLYGVEARGSFWRLWVGGEYRQGRMWQDHLRGARTRVISARGSVGISVLPWMAVTAGPHLSRVGTPAGDRQIVRWRLGTVLTVPLVGDLLQGVASVAGSVAGTAAEGAGFAGSGGGGEVGLRIEPLGRPIWARLGYRVDREYLQLDRSHHIQTAFLTVGVSIPRATSRR